MKHHYSNILDQHLRLRALIHHLIIQPLARYQHV